MDEAGFGKVMFGLQIAPTALSATASKAEVDEHKKLADEFDEKNAASFTRVCYWRHRIAPTVTPAWHLR